MTKDLFLFLPSFTRDEQQLISDGRDWIPTDKDSPVRRKGAIDLSDWINEAIADNLINASSSSTTSSASVLAYDASLAYSAGDQRIYRSVTVEANSAIVANTAFNWGNTGATWKPVVPSGHTWRGVWLIGTAYSINDVVTLSTTSNELYVATSANTGNDPSSSANTRWKDYRFIDFDVFTGATTSTGSRVGLVPPTFAGQTDGFLRSDGEFSVPALGTLLVANKATGGDLHSTSSTTPDYIDRYVVTQTTAGQTMTVANASTVYNRGRLIYVQNSSASTVSFTIYGKVLTAGAFVPLYWTGSTWIPLNIDGTGSVAIGDWAASTAYVANQIVKSGNRYLKRTAAGTSGATFTNTEAALWTLLSNDAIGTWVATTYYYAGEKLTDGNVIFTRTNSGISGASLNAAEWFQYQYLSQKQIPSWTGSTAYIQGMKVYSAAPQQTLLILTASSHTTAASFTLAESSNWTFVSPALYYIPIPTALYRVGDFALNPTNQTILMRNTADHTYSGTWTVGEAASWTLISQGTISTWTASTIYLAGTKVNYKGGTIERIATGNSGATFDATEGAAWISLVAGFDNWTASTYYYADTIIGGTFSDRLIKRVADGISAATFSLVEAGAYGLVKPVRRMPFAGATIYYASEQMTDVVNGTITYQAIAPHLSNATLDAAGLTAWTLIGGNPYTSIANAPYTVRETDDMIDLPAGATFAITIPASRVNPIIKFSTVSLSATPPTIVTSGAETIIDPVSYTAGTSIVMPGTAGLASSATFQKVGNSYRFIA